MTHDAVPHHQAPTPPSAAAARKIGQVGITRCNRTAHRTRRRVAAPRTVLNEGGRGAALGGKSTSGYLGSHTSHAQAAAALATRSCTAQPRGSQRAAAQSGGQRRRFARGDQRGRCTRSSRGPTSLWMDSAHEKRSLALCTSSRTHTQVCVRMCVCACVRACVCVCVCVCIAPSPPFLARSLCCCWPHRVRCRPLCRPQ
jgi:hypothetical protein